MTDSEDSSSAENSQVTKEEREEKKKAIIKCHKGHKLKYTSPKVLNSNGYDNAYKCNLCGHTFYYQGSYHCNKCKYDLCENCYDNRADGKCVDKHPLQSFTTQENHEYRCSGCDNTMDKGVVCYGCRICDYDLCPNCFSYKDKDKKKEDHAGGFAHFGALGGLLQMINNHMNFMNQQEANVDDFISKSGSADLLRTAKTAALDTERELMEQIMNLSEINNFLNNIILVENLFNSIYTKDIKTQQESARQQYGTNIDIYEEKLKPQSDIGSFVELMFAGTNLHISSFKKWLQKVVDECEAKHVRIVESSGARGKNIERAFYKSFYVYALSHGNEGYKQMTDVLRCSLVFDDFDDLYHCFSIIEQLSNEGILRVKDRFNPSNQPFGYRDMLINIYCPGSKVVAEIQLHHKLFYDEKKVSHDIYKKARLFEENEENMAYKYADEHIRKVIGEKKYKAKKSKMNEDDDDDEDEDQDKEVQHKQVENKEEEEEEEDIMAQHQCEMSAEALFQEWKLTKYTESFISDEGYDDPKLWKDITMDELRNDYGFKAGHAKKFISYVQELEKERPQFAEIQKRRMKIKKQKAKEAKVEIMEEVEAPQKPKQKTSASSNTKQALAQPMSLNKSNSNPQQAPSYIAPPQQYAQPPSYSSPPQQQYAPPQQQQYIPQQPLNDVLPPGWAALMTNDGKVYYANNITKQTQWTKPQPQQQFVPQTQPQQYITMNQPPPQYGQPIQPQQQQYAQPPQYGQQLPPYTVPPPNVQHTPLMPQNSQYGIAQPQPQQHLSQASLQQNTPYGSSPQLQYTQQRQQPYIQQNNSQFNIPSMPQQASTQSQHGNSNTLAQSPHHLPQAAAVQAHTQPQYVTQQQYAQQTIQQPNTQYNPPQTVNLAQQIQTNQHQQMIQQQMMQQQASMAHVQNQYGMVKTGTLSGINKVDSLNSVDSMHKANSMGHSVQISGLDDIENDTDHFHEELADEIAQEDDKTFGNAFDSLYGNQQRQQQH